MKKLFLLLALWPFAAFAQQSPHGELTMACEACHSDSWAMRPDPTFNHDSTGFPLTGRHRVAGCRSCHEHLVFTRKSPDCSVCHTDVHRQELGSACLRCHTTDSWIVTDMKARHQSTRFPLVGRHVLALCDDCHNRASEHRYAATPLTCITCHKSEFDATSAPNHAASGFPIDCSQCHAVNAVRWTTGFDHNNTRFPLTGAHRAIVCGDCHRNNQFTNLSTACYDCHSADFMGVQSPNHQTGMFSRDCRTCHTTLAWQPATFDHSATRFTLTGKHRTIDCQACHAGGNYQLAYSDCYQCHQNDFTTPTDPNHVSAGFSHNCQDCHGTTSWLGSSFDHSTTRFPLTGAHTTTACRLCHTGGNYQLSYSSCYQCHQADYEQTTNPGHVALNFDHNCTSCHSTTSWSTQTFDHNTTHFILTGTHLTTACLSCHTNDNYQLAYSNCYQCHTADYQRPTNPNHVAGMFGYDCTPCHTTTAFLPSTFSHVGTGFTLTGKHLLIQCQDCHTGGNYRLTLTDCYQCHQTDYAVPTNPNHVTANFGHDCSPCHTTSAWIPSTFNHDLQYFKIYSGAHQGNWTLCTDCHTNPADYSLYSCVNCHTHNQTTTDQQHTGVSGYTYQSSACYSCHRNR